MYKRAIKGIIVILLLVAFVLISFVYNDWFAITMARHQLMQLPAMIAIGIVLALTYPIIHLDELSWGIASLLFVMTSLIFWMLPLSIDFAVIDSSINRVMHIDMIVCGVVIASMMRSRIFELKIAFLGMITAMLFATGIALRSFNILLCSSFDIDQQKETGLILVFVGISLFIFTIYSAIRTFSLNKYAD